MRAILFLLSAAVGLVAAQDINTVPACGQTCFNNMKGQFGCGAADQKCLCDHADYRNGLKDCVNQSCGADVTPATTALNTYVEAVCAAAAAASPAASASSAAPPASSAPPPPPSSAAPVPTTTAPVLSTSASPSPSTSASPTAAAPAAVSSSSSSSSSSSASSSSTTGSSTSSSATSTSTSEASAGTATHSEGLSSTTKIGIGIGGAAAALGVIGILVCVYLHRRNQRRDSGQGRRLQISDPMPGAGRTYAGDHFNDKYHINSSSDMDFKSRRYEDMLPRQTPRNMV